MTRELRRGKRQYGLVLANGGVLTYQHAICISSTPRQAGSVYPAKAPLPPYVTHVPAPIVDVHAEGEAIVETYTVEYNRDGTPSIGFVIGRLSSNSHRFVANTGDLRTLKELTSRTKEPIGREGWVKNNDGKNSFVFHNSESL
ncbi:hypothetical protein ACLMJK_008702 [Lecanora helva]